MTMADQGEGRRSMRARAHEERAAAPLLVSLDDPRATDPSLAGAKAANLAKAAVAHLPVLGGFVVTTAAPIVDLDGAHGELLPADVEAELHRWWTLVSDNGARPVVARSSSPVEDAEHSSMAGQFTSVLDIRGWDAFLRAVRDVLASGAVPRAGTGDGTPMAVLVQPYLEASCGGVLFGIDPVTGSRRHVAVEVVAGNPDALVSGVVTAARAVLTRRGRLVEGDAAELAPLLDTRRRRQLARLAERAAETFGGPQDVEWAFDANGELWLLQSRPITAVGDSSAASGPVLGPGPVAETFPEPLDTLEADLWVEPMAAGIVGALRVTGAAPRRKLVTSPVVDTIDGWLVADLELLGVAPAKRSLWKVLDPRGPGRRLAAAWRVGRVRRALPALAGDVVAEIDHQLAAVPPLPTLEAATLIGILERSRQSLVAVHGHEVLAGMLLGTPTGAREPTGAEVALGALRDGRQVRLSDSEIVAVDPSVLILVPPRIGREVVLPDVPASPPAHAAPASRRRGFATTDLGPREALRLRARWLHELSARAALELGARLAAAGVLTDASDVRHLSLTELVAVAAGGPVPGDLASRRSSRGVPPPAAFRLSPTGAPVPVADRRRSRRGIETPGAGRGAGGGRGTGVVVHHDGPAGAAVPPGSVLVVRTLDPGLAAVLPGLGGLVAETGSVLSHLAILAREMGVPTVVGVAGAHARFPAGAVVAVDGGTGDVTVLDQPAGSRLLDGEEVIA